jgi:hypothetical protein
MDFISQSIYVRDRNRKEQQNKQNQLLKYRRRRMIIVADNLGPGRMPTVIFSRPLVAFGKADWREMAISKTHPRFSCHEVTAQAFCRQSFLERSANQHTKLYHSSFFLRFPKPYLNRIPSTNGRGAALNMKPQSIFRALLLFVVSVTALTGTPLLH